MVFCWLGIFLFINWYSYLGALSIIPFTLIYFRTYNRIYTKPKTFGKKTKTQWG